MADGARGAPETRLQRAIAGIWQELLGLEQVDVEADFFELGGESLSAVRMLAAVEELLLASVSFPDFLAAPSVAGLTEAVESARRDLTAPPGPAAALAPPARPAAGAPTGPDPASAPCSFAQQRLWFVDRLDGANGAYNEIRGARIRGQIDTAALERALREVVARHDALRTTFSDRGGEPVQIVSPEPRIVLDRRAATPADLGRLAEDLATTPFDLERGPLIRAHLLELAPDDHVLQLVIHHAVSDGWSHVVLLRELGELYRAHCAGVEAGLPAPRAQYPEFAHGQRAELNGEALEAAVAPWVERLCGAPTELALPRDRPRPPAPSYRGANHVIAVPDEIAHAVRRFARETRSTPFATMLSTYYVLLARLSGQRDIVIGATTSGRAHAELEDAIGLFASTVALRCAIQPGESFRSLLARVRETVMWAVAHEQAPFEKVVAQLGLERDLSRHPVFQVFCAHVSEVPMPLPGAEPFQARVAASRFDLTLFVEEQPNEGMRLAWEYSRDLFDASTIRRWASEYLEILRAGLAAPDAPVELDGSPERPDGAAARGQGSGAPAAGFPVACMHELFEARVRERPDAVALTFGEEALTYAELNRAANRLAHRLRELGAGAETLVALFLEPSLELVIAILGVLKAGAAYVPLDPAYPAERIEFVLEDTAAPLLVTVSDLRARVPAHGGRTVCIDAPEEPISGHGAEDPTPLGGPESLAYVIYTSGSTGRPKGVQIEHRHIARLFTATDPWYGFGAEDVWVLLHSYAFDFSVWELWGALAYGGRLVISPLWTTRSPPALAALVAEEQVTVMNATPSLFAVVQDELLQVADRLALRYVIFGGEALQPASLRPWYERFRDGGAQLVNMYGITETTVHVTYRPITAADCRQERSPIGVPIPDLSLHLLDPAGAPVPDGVAGELHVGGAGVARGYLNRPELTAERFVANPAGGGRLYRTGDLARRTTDGELEFRGRIDDQVKVRGFRIELGEIQAAIRDLPGIGDCAVIAIDVAPGDTRLAAYVVASGERQGEALTHAVTTALEQRLPEYMVPASVIAVAQLPLTRNGKTDRQALPPPTWAAGPDAGAEAPRTESERVIAEIWSSVLGIESPGRQDNFFHLGGHSLLAARVGTQVRRQCNVDLSVRALFEQPTLAGFAAYVDSLRGEDPAAQPDPAQRSGRVSPEVGAGATGGAPPERPSSATAPTSFQQDALLFFDALDPGSSIYNAPLAVRVAGPLHLEALRRALESLLARHEALRTVFAYGEGEIARQVVLEEWQLELEQVDLGVLPAAERAAELERQLREHAARPFDLRHDVMLRASVFRLGPLGHVILLASHHIVLDAWAVEILYRELGELYAAALRRGEPSLPPLPLQYREFATRQRERLRGERLAGELAFWRTQLAGAPPMLNLPLDRPRPAEPTFAGETLRVALPGELADAVRRVAQARRLTPYMLLLGVFATLLYRRTGDDDILLGGPMAGRADPEYESLIGFCATTNIVRVRLAGNPPLAELLDGVRESVLATYEHQEVPLELVVDAVRPERVPGVNPLFQVNFRVRVGTLPVPELSGCRTSLVAVELPHARFDLAAELHVGADELTAQFNYNTALFDPATVAALADDFEALLRQALEEPERRLLAFALPERARPALEPGDGARAGIRGFRRAART